MAFGTLGFLGSGGGSGVTVASESWVEATTVDSSTLAIPVASSATAHTKGSWVELITSLDSDCTMLEFQVTEVSVTLSSFAIDIGVGGAGSEAVVIDNITFGAGGDSIIGTHSNIFRVPISIAAGSRIAVRCAFGLAGGSTMYVHLNAIAGGYAGTLAPSTADCLVTITNSHAVDLDPGAVANTFSSYVELVASTAQDYDGVVISVNDRGAGSGISRRQVEIATGAASSEVKLLDVYHVKAAFRHFHNQYFGPYYFSIPAGTRLSARAKCDSTTSNDRYCYVNVHGFVAS